jgi:SSS family solute:Na+ symporter
VKSLGDSFRHRSFPAFVAHRFGAPTGTLAAFFSALGYAGFTGSQVLAGAKLGSAAFDIPVVHAVVAMSAVIVLYTALGGLQAVIYTDTVQWAILLLGLSFLGLPLALRSVGGVDALVSAVPPELLSLSNISPGQLGVWMVTIVPVWFVAMTAYQRIHAARDLKTARRAWFLAGLLEYPAMAFLGAALGLCARVLYPTVDPEMGLPLLIRNVLPVGACGLLLAAYFAAIMSTADSCLLASVGNVADDLLGPLTEARVGELGRLRLARLLTVAIGFGSVAFALYVPSVIESILLAYSVLVGGLFVPTLAALFWKRVPGLAAFASMLVGGGTTVVLQVVPARVPIEPVVAGLVLSCAALVAVTVMRPRQELSKSRSGATYG